MAAHLPYLKFFVNDWLSDEKISLCSLAAQGLWIRLLCLMHKNGRRGYLQQDNGLPLTLGQLSRATGTPTAEAAHLLQELTDSGVASVTAEGVLYNRRMVREERLSEVRRAAGKKGGNPILVKQTAKQNSSKTVASEEREVFLSGERNAPQRAPSLGMGVQGEGDLLKQNSSKFACACGKDDCLETVAVWCAREWELQNRKTVNGHKTEGTEDAIPVMTFLLESGVSQEAILEELRNKRRDHTEWLGDFKKRMLPRNGRDRFAGIRDFLSQEAG